MYADYTYYSTAFYGDAIPIEQWPKYAMLASQYIDYMTFGKAAENAELPEIRNCCCALAEQYQSIDAVRRAASAKVTDDGIIASESVGSHSRSFRSGVDGQQAVQGAEAELSNIVRRYLLPTGLLYRGVSTCVHTAQSHDL